jgi:hypothetical protein
MRWCVSRSRAITKKWWISVRGRASRPVVEVLEARLCLSGYLVVASYDSNKILRYDESTGAFVDQIDPKNLANLNSPTCLVFGPDRNLYVSDRLFTETDPSTLNYVGTYPALNPAVRITAPSALTAETRVVIGPVSEVQKVRPDHGGPEMQVRQILAVQKVRPGQLKPESQSPHPSVQPADTTGLPARNRAIDITRTNLGAS